MANENQSEEQRRANYARVVARAWHDETFKEKLKNNPRDALADHGVKVPSGAKVKVVENSAEIVHFVLPTPPRDELSEEDLMKIAGGLQCDGCN